VLVDASAVRGEDAVPTEGMAEIAGMEDWHPARLIPVAGIRGQEEQEARAASAFLAVLGAVPAFATSVLGPFGAPRGKVETYCEVRIKDVAGRVSRPDGAIVITRGAKSWRALVELKTGTEPLSEEQVNRYLDLARENGFDCVITISNEIVSKPTDVPVAYDRRKTRRTGLYHVSWWRILTKAVIEHRHRGISDPEQAWILGELIAYLLHENSGASGFQDMGRSWVQVREGARHGTLRAGDASVREVAERWEQLLDYMGLALSQELGRDVAPARPRKQTRAERVDEYVRRLAKTGELSGALRVPDAVGPIEIAANLRTRQVTTSVLVAAPTEGRQPTRVNWLLRQLRDADPHLRLGATFANTRETSGVLLAVAREQPQTLLHSANPRREIRSFEVALTRALGLKNGRGAGSFVGETRTQLFDFYGDVVQNLTAPQRRAPRLPEVTDVSEVTEPSAA
jgi:hypothetical protein